MYTYVHSNLGVILGPVRVELNSLADLRLSHGLKGVVVTFVFAGMIFNTVAVP